MINVSNGSFAGNDRTIPGETHLVVLVLLIHSTFTLLIGNDLACVLHNDLVGFKAAVATHTISSVFGLEDLNTYAVTTSLLGSFCEHLESSVLAELFADVAVCLITLVQHDPILAVLCASVFRRTYTLGSKILKVRSLLPNCRGLADETV